MKFVCKVDRRPFERTGAGRSGATAVTADRGCSWGRFRGRRSEQLAQSGRQAFASERLSGGYFGHGALQFALIQLLVPTLQQASFRTKKVSQLALVRFPCAFAPLRSGEKQCREMGGTQQRPSNEIDAAARYSPTSPELSSYPPSIKLLWTTGERTNSEHWFGGRRLG
eukprot:GHVT01011598.1.p2 GENE.GHVT01011598.1~~GHVT01011598.1.p2  ORF type:complete len:168 (-),score=31.63 GHVT01011598.1:4657-5160(-)